MHNAKESSQVVQVQQGAAAKEMVIPSYAESATREHQELQVWKSERSKLESHKDNAVNFTLVKESPMASRFSSFRNIQCKRNTYN